MQTTCLANPRPRASRFACASRLPRCAVALCALALCAVPPLAAQQRIDFAPHRSLRCPPHSSHCVLREGSHLHPITLPRDTTTLKHDTATLKLVATLPFAIVLIDSYSSSPRGLQECQAGTESFLRILSLGPPQPTLTYSTKLESCLQNVELSLDGVAWDASTHHLAIHWLQSPDTGKPQDTTLTLDNSGHPHLLSTPQIP